MRVVAAADGGPPSGTSSSGLGDAQAIGRAFDIAGVTVEFVAQRHRHGVVQVRAARFFHVPELVGFFTKQTRELIQRGNEFAEQLRQATRMAVSMASLVDCDLLT